MPDFVNNTADPLGAIDAQVTNIKANIDKIFNGGNNRGLNLIDTSARDLSFSLIGWEKDNRFCTKSN